MAVKKNLETRGRKATGRIKPRKQYIYLTEEQDRILTQQAKNDGGRSVPSLVTAIFN